jgi:hypothetical protein
VLAAQSDLFDRPTLAGLAQAEAIVTECEEQALIASIDAGSCRRSASRDGLANG